MGYERPLKDLASVEHFMQACLPRDMQYTDKAGNPLSVEQIFAKIEDAELLARNAGCTQRESVRRMSDYRSDDARERLHAKIVQELVELNRLPNDEDIKLGSGGAKPLTNPKFERQAYLITGLPASGKSTIAAKVCDYYGAYLIDPDFAKRKIPEFDKSIAGASRVHRESMQISLGNADASLPNLLAACLGMEANIVRPLIGNEKQKLDLFGKMLKDRGYAVHLCLVDLDRKNATGRALKRYLETERYVSLPYIFDDCANDASLIYYRYRTLSELNNASCIWDSFGAISTAEHAPTKIDVLGVGNPAELF